MQNTREGALPDLLRHLDLEHRGGDVHRGIAQEGRNPRIFGGLVFSQAMQAAIRTVEEDRTPHSAHGYFLRPGDPKKPIDYAVERIRDGRSFTTRRVVASQYGEVIFNLSISFHGEEQSDTHQIDAKIPAEPSGESHEAGIRRGLQSGGIEISEEEFGFGAFELLVEGGLDMSDAPARDPQLRCWIRGRGAIREERPGLQESLLAYVSDLTIMIACYHPLAYGPMSRGVQGASLDHAIWFHAPFRVDDWLYAVQESPVLHGARGLGRALFYTRDGRLVASAAQEGLVRVRD